MKGLFFFPLSLHVRENQIKRGNLIIKCVSFTRERGKTINKNIIFMKMIFLKWKVSLLSLIKFYFFELCGSNIIHRCPSISTNFITHFDYVCISIYIRREKLLHGIENIPLKPLRWHHSFLIFKLRRFSQILSWILNLI